MSVSRVEMNPQPPHWVALPVAEATVSHGVFHAGIDPSYSFVISVPDGFDNAELIDGAWYWVADPPLPPSGTLWRHKDGDVYVVTGHPDIAPVKVPGGGWLRGPWVEYANDGNHYVRTLRDFLENFSQQKTPD